MIKGTRHALLCRKRRNGEDRQNCGWLGLPEELWTKADSLPFANKWWEENAPKAVDPAFKLLTDTFSDRVDTEVLKEMFDDAQKANRVIARSGIPREIVTPKLFNEVLQKVDLIPEVEPVPKDKTIKGLADRFILGIQEDSRKGIRSPDGADNIRRWLLKFVEYAGAKHPIESIDFIRWEAWGKVCKAKSVNMETEEGAKDYQTAKRFVRWCWKQDLLDLPKNFDDKLGFTKWEADIVTYTPANIKKTLALATGQLKLHLLLMLNCGMTQKDISDLLKSQVNLEAGTISRKRSKTRSKKKTPLVTYTLWKPTIELLRQYWSNHETLALVTKSGRAWCRKITLPNGKFKKADNIGTLWGNLKKANPDADYLGALISFKKSSSTLLRNSEYSEFYSYFLGHAEKTMAGQHYAGLDPARFAEAQKWLGKQYGI